METYQFNSFQKKFYVAFLSFIEEFFFLFCCLGMKKLEGIISFENEWKFVDFTSRRLGRGTEGKVEPMNLDWIV
jgi:hypothetical protein